MNCVLYMALFLYCFHLSRYADPPSHLPFLPSVREHNLAHLANVIFPTAHFCLSNSGGLRNFVLVLILVGILVSLILLYVYF